MDGEPPKNDGRFLRMDATERKGSFDQAANGILIG